ncbi:MAG: 4'-phosphopantetheinyl transferase superfamily protein, partial [Pseudomonadota bacterium]
MLDWKLATRNDLLQEIGGEDGAKFLQVSERRRLAGITQAGRRDEFIASRWLARKTLCANFGGTAGDWDIAAEHGQAPLVTGPAPAYLSMSHSGEWIAVAVSDGAVGLDIERVKQRKNTLALARMAATPRESLALEALQEPARSALFIQFWTIKEAWLKSRGSGLDFDLMRRLTNEEATPSWLR